MLEFEAMKPLLSFFNVPMNPKSHQSNFTGWVMVKCVHKKMIIKMKKVVEGLKYLVISYDEVITIDNQRWVSIHYYTVEDWCHFFILIFFKLVTEGRVTHPQAP
jgi:hypothetical protein